MEEILEVHNLEKKYPGFELKDVSFALTAGSITGFIGRNGAGKTTAMKCIVNLIKKDGGEIRMFGLDFASCEKECKSRLSFLLEGHDYYPRIPIRKLTAVTRSFYPNWDQEEYEKCLKAFDLKEEQCLKEMSNGMKLKYQLAIALSHKAELLILDEPTSGLDPVSRDEIQDIFTNLVKDGRRSILFSTHITSDLDNCADRLIYINKGKIVLADEKENFLTEFVLVKGSKEKAGKEYLSSLISYKEEGNAFTGLGYASKTKKIAGLEYQVPDIEQIMVFYERSSRHEEIIY